MTTRILVTGGLGVVGKPLVAALRTRGHEVYVADLPHDADSSYYSRCDVAQFRQLEGVINHTNPDLVYHLAAEFGRHNGEDFYETMWQTNVIGNKNMISLQAKKRFRMVFASSSEVYGDYRKTMTEDVPEGFPVRQLNDYAISKWVNEQQIMNSMDQLGTETVILRLFNSYGPGETYSPYRSAVCIFVYSALHNLPYTVYSTNRRTLTYIDDMVNAMANVAGSFNPGEVYNIAGDESASMKEVSDIVLRLTMKNNGQSLARYEDSEKHNALYKIADNSKARAELGLRNTVDLEEGIRRTVDWQRTVYRG